MDNQTQFRADLHCHSTASDGSVEPSELIKLAEKEGLSGLSITDHDTTAAYSKVGQTSIKLLPGIEFSARLGKESVHILGYSFLPEHPKIIAFCEAHLKRRRDRNLEILENLKKTCRIDIDPEALNQFDTHSPGRVHIAELLMKSGATTSIREGFQRYLAEGKAAYAPGEPVSVHETLELIRSINGIAIIAHPHLIARRKVLEELFTLPFDGLEGYYGRFAHPGLKSLINRAQNLGWMITGGSDFHGKARETVHLGDSWTPFETFNKLWQRYQENLATTTP